MREIDEINGDWKIYCRIRCILEITQLLKFLPGKNIKHDHPFSFSSAPPEAKALKGKDRHMKKE